MSALAILAIVAGILLAAVVLVGVGTAVRTRAMQDRDLELAEALAGEETTPSLEPRARPRSPVIIEAAELRGVLESATSGWEDLTFQVQSALVERAASLWDESPGELASFINDLIEAGREPHAGVLLLSVDPDRLVAGSQVGPSLYVRPSVSTVTWYRDQLLSLHPAYLATRAALLERVTQLITLTIRLELSGLIPRRETYRRNPRYRG
jgi:hypothetical protein